MQRIKDVFPYLHRPIDEWPDMECQLCGGKGKKPPWGKGSAIRFWDDNTRVLCNCPLPFEQGSKKDVPCPTTQRIDRLMEDVSEELKQLYRDNPIKQTLPGLRVPQKYKPLYEENNEGSGYLLYATWLGSDGPVIHEKEWRRLGGNVYDYRNVPQENTGPITKCYEIFVDLQEVEVCPSTGKRQIKPLTQGDLS